MAIAPETTAPSTAEFAGYLDSKLEAQRNSTLIQLGCVAAAILCIGLASALQAPINKQRKELQLVTQSNVYKELPPEYAWVSAGLGTFRGIIADIMWARAEQLKEDGKYFELHQLAKWICTLEPRFGPVWQFQAWNMSYNISVATHTAPERWQWVYNGIRLLRDEGVPNNEHNMQIYQQLAWIWFHKVGDRMDDFHMSYKRVWATTMDVLLGSPPPGATSKEGVDWFRPVGIAPVKLKDVEVSHPGVVGLAAQLKDIGIDVNVGTDNQRLFHPLEEKFFQPYTKYLQRSLLASLRSKPGEVSPENAKLFAVLDAAPKADLDPLLAWMRAKVLREQYKMDPQYMLALSSRLDTKEPLPIDWRTPWSQGLYWGALGSDKAAEMRNPKEFETLQVDRVYLFAIKTMVKQGRYIFRANVDHPLESFLNMTPDLRWIEAMHKKYLELGQKHKDEGEDIGDTAGETLRSGHVNELHDAIVSLYLAGHVDEAREYLAYLAKNYKEMYTKKIQDQYLQDVETFVMGQLKEMVDSYQTASQLVYSLLSRAYLGLASGYADEYASWVRNAGIVYEAYQKDKEKDPEGRRALPSFAQMQAGALANLALQPDWPPSIRSAVWLRVTNPEVKQPIYDFVIPQLTRQCEEAGLDVEKAFPAPIGMQQWRAAHPNMQGVGQFEKKEEKKK